MDGKKSSRHPVVEATAPSPATLVGASYDDPEYRDAYLIRTNGEVTVEDFATGFFLSQPTWLARVSMNLGGKQSRRSAIGESDYAIGSTVGSWKVRERAHDEIVFGEHMGFMEFRFSVYLRPDGDIEASTVVKYLNRFAPIYFTVVKPFHRGFIRIALGNAAKHALGRADLS